MKRRRWRRNRMASLWSGFTFYWIVFNVLFWAKLLFQCFLCTFKITFEHFPLWHFDIFRKNHHYMDKLTFVKSQFLMHFWNRYMWEQANLQFILFLDDMFWSDMDVFGWKVKVERAFPLWKVWIKVFGSYRAPSSHAHHAAGHPRQHVGDANHHHYTSSTSAHHSISLLLFYILPSHLRL